MITFRSHNVSNARPLAISPLHVRAMRAVASVRVRTAHDSKDFQNKKALKCVNCVAAKRPNTVHAASDKANCPILVGKIKQKMSFIMAGSKKPFLKVCHLNAQSLEPHFSDIISIMRVDKVHILAISES